MNELKEYVQSIPDLADDLYLANAEIVSAVAIEDLERKRTELIKAIMYLEGEVAAIEQKIVAVKTELQMARITDPFASMVGK